MEEHVRDRYGRRHHHERSRRCVDADADRVGQQLLRDAVRVRLGSHEEPGRRVPVGPDRSGSGRSRARSARSVQATRARDAHHGPRVADGSDLRADLATVLREPRRVRRRVRPRLVQAHPSRHGAGVALPRSRGARRGAHLAGPRTGGRPRARRRERHRVAEGQDPRLGAVGVAVGVGRVGVRIDVPRR